MCTKSYWRYDIVQYNLNDLYKRMCVHKFHWKNPQYHRN